MKAEAFAELTFSTSGSKLLPFQEYRIRCDWAGRPVQDLPSEADIEGYAVFLEMLAVDSERMLPMTTR